MILEIHSEENKDSVFNKVQHFLKQNEFKISNQDQSRPWGGFFVIDENQASYFASLFFPHLKMSDIEVTAKLSPKILIVAPKERLSWQFHYRRSEIWKVINGKVGFVSSLNDHENPSKTLVTGDCVKLDKEERHRLIGHESWAIIAEIWQHTDIENPSNEEDIVRLQDDFGR
jgi:mannose-6-phosphate isomerase-like protein (cupin superfamily)